LLLPKKAFLRARRLIKMTLICPDHCSSEAGVLRLRGPGVLFVAASLMRRPTLVKGFSNGLGRVGPNRAAWGALGRQPPVSFAEALPYFRGKGFGRVNPVSAASSLKFRPRGNDDEDGGAFLSLGWCWIGFAGRRAAPIMKSDDCAPCPGARGHRHGSLLHVTAHSDRGRKGESGGR